MPRPAPARMPGVDDRTWRVASLVELLDAAPDVARRFHDEPELRCLRLHRDLVAVHRARKPALRRQAELLHRHELGSRIDAALQVVLRLELAHLRAHEAEYDRLVLGHVAQRSEIAGA